MSDDICIFQEEADTIARAQTILWENRDAVPVKHFADLLVNYKKLYRQSLRLTKMGDRTMNQLNRLYERLSAAEEKYRSIFERSIQGIFRCAASGRLLDVNPAMAAMFGYESCQAMLDEVGNVADNIFFSQSQYRKFFQTIWEQGALKDYPLRLHRRSGEEIWVELSVQGIFDTNGTLKELEGLAADVTEKRRMLHELKTLARVDGLTGLWNRRYFIELGSREVTLAQRDERPLSLLYFDLDKFKDINDTYGHRAGDRVLEGLAGVGLKVLRQSDVFARMGGDEFAVLMPGTRLEEAYRVAERMRDSFHAHRVVLDNGKILFSASFGVVQYTRDIPDISTLINRADKALYEAKHGGRNQVMAACAEERGNAASSRDPENRVVSSDVGLSQHKFSAQG